MPARRRSPRLRSRLRVRRPCRRSSCRRWSAPLNPSPWRCGSGCAWLM